MIIRNRKNTKTGPREKKVTWMGAHRIPTSNEGKQSPHPCIQFFMEIASPAKLFTDGPKRHPKDQWQKGAIDWRIREKVGWLIIC